MTETDVSGPADRRTTALSFGRAADAYDRFRPGYPAAAVADAVGDAQAVLDLGAGTGKLTRLVDVSGVPSVWAVEPDADMLGVLARLLPAVTAIEGSAERIPIADAAVDAVVVGQALHWFDLDVALPEIARVLRPAGRLVCLWNTSDVRDDFTRRWVSALDATVRPHGGATGRTTRRDLPPTSPFTGRSEFTDPRPAVHDWTFSMPAEDLHHLAGTYSYVLTASPDRRDAMHRELDRLIGGSARVTLAQRCQVWTAVRR